MDMFVSTEGSAQCAGFDYLARPRPAQDSGCALRSQVGGIRPQMQVLLEESAMVKECSER